MMERAGRESFDDREERRRLASQAAFKLANEEKEQERSNGAEHAQRMIGAGDDEHERQNVDGAWPDQSLENTERRQARQNVRPGMIARPNLGNIGERQAAMQRELNADFGQVPEIDNDIDRDDD